MIREGKVLGAIATARPGAEPFDDHQIALIKSFADQAVIANRMDAGDVAPLPVRAPRRRR